MYKTVIYLYKTIIENPLNLVFMRCYRILLHLFIVWFTGSNPVTPILRNLCRFSVCEVFLCLKIRFAPLVAPLQFFYALYKAPSMRSAYYHARSPGFFICRPAGNTSTIAFPAKILAYKFLRNRNHLLSINDINHIAKLLNIAKVV